jgi:D-alanyl-D-alanine dipeptidase
MDENSMATPFFHVPLVLQLLVVVSPDWSAKEGVLCQYQRNPVTLQWSHVATPIQVTLGKNGMAWGRGVSDFSSEKGPSKKESDGKSPAGIFTLDSAFGNASHQAFAKKIPYLLVTADLECVDDPHSMYYNQFVTASTQNRDWTSSEKMKEIGFLYDLGLVVGHNLHPIEPGKGSAIFLHIWRNQNTATPGCTVMEEKALNQIVSWLDAEQHPCLVQLPLQEYMQRKSAWGLPELPISVSEAFSIEPL